MSRPLPVALLCALIALPALAGVPASVPADRLTEPIDGSEFILWLSIERTAKDAEVLVALAPDSNRPAQFSALRLSGDATEIYDVAGAAPELLGRRGGALPAVGASGELSVRRRGGDLVVALDGEARAQFAVEGFRGTAGAWATRGATVEDLLAQPLAGIEFAEDFYQVEDVPGRWETLAGEWQVGVYWDPLQERDNRPIGASWYQPGPGACLTATGYDFWDCYVQEATLRLPAGVGGLAFHVAGPEDFCAFEVGGGAGRIVQVRGGQRTVLAQGPVTLNPEWAYRLRAEVAAGHVRCFVNDDEIAEADLSPALTGRVGFFAQDAPDARFDDLAVTPFAAARIPGGASAPEALEFRGGSWEVDGGVLRGRAPDGQAAVLRGSTRAGAQEVGARVSATRGATVGVIAGHEFGDRALIFSITAAAQPTWQLHSVRGGKSEKVAQGPAPAAGGEMLLRYAGGRVSCLLDGALLGQAFVTGAVSGRSGVYLQGGRANFADFVARELSDEPQAVISVADGNNEPMPALEEKQFIRAIPNLWRSRGGSWRVQPTEAGPMIVARGRPGDARTIARFHEVTPGEPRLIVDAGEAAGGTVSLAICVGSEPGYEARFAPGEGTVRLLRRGEVVHEAAAEEGAARLPGEIRRDGDSIIVSARRDGALEPVCAWRDPEPLPDGFAEVTVTGEEVRFREIVLASDSARAYKFNRVEPDWQPASGGWTDHTGMACILWDYWMTADGREEPALTWNRRPMPGDVTLDVSAAEYTDGFADGEHRHYPYHDIRLALCGDPDTADAGYAFIVGADGGRRTVLLRNGVEVAATDDPRYRIVMGGHNNTPRAVRLRAQKAGGVLTLTFNGSEALRWEDPEPLGGGRVGLGAAGCRVLFRDCVIYPAAGAAGS